MKVYDNGLSLNTKILTGVNKLADAVSATLGPKGKNVVIHFKGKKPIITKDGVTVAEAIELQDPFENVGAQVLKQASAVTATEAGDGTTTATVLARSIMNEAQKYMQAGKLVSDMVILKMMQDRLAEDDCSMGNILDGLNLMLVIKVLFQP